MVYPQWSQGRNVRVPFDANKGGATGTVYYDITQPFSQIPTATPVIRVRVGDLIRSNYSRFNLKRIFGFKDQEKKQEEGQSVKDTVSGYTLPPDLYTKVTLTAGEWRLTDDFVEINESVEIGPGAVLMPTLDGQESLSRFVTVNGDTIVVNKDVLIASTTQYRASADPGDFVNGFYQAEGDKSNAIVKSFESTMGMGLASVVTQLQFTWMDGLWGAGEDGPGWRAPRSCKVQMSFDPIHDIAPGLDHEGLNRAPIYPVGRLVNNLVEGEENSPYGVGSVRYDGKFLMNKG
jgi:hypothetical protein